MYDPKACFVAVLVANFFTIDNKKERIDRPLSIYNTIGLDRLSFNCQKAQMIGEVFPRMSLDFCDYSSAFPI
jgi:hypothetical protein